MRLQLLMCVDSLKQLPHSHSSGAVCWLDCRISDTEAKYYADGEDAYYMQKPFRGHILPAHKKSDS